MRRSYQAALRATLRQTAAAYGYTLSIATTVAILTSVRGAPHTGDLFLFVAGGLGAFAALEAMLELAGQPDERHLTSAFPFAGGLNVFAVSAALGSSVGVAHALASELAWLVAPLAATAARSRART